MSGGSRSRYDPDTMVAADLDLTDVDVLDAYLGHPVMRALAEGLGRQFRQLPADVQLLDLSRYHKQLMGERERLGATTPRPATVHRPAALHKLKRRDPGGGRPGSPPERLSWSAAPGRW